MEPSHNRTNDNIIFENSKIKKKNSTPDLRITVLKKNHLQKILNEKKSKINRSSSKVAEPTDNTIICRLPSYFTCFFR